MDVVDPVSPADADLIAIDDQRYPPLLREIHAPPSQLYVRGQLAVLQRPQLAIVGSRHASPAGVKLAQQLAAGLVEAGLSVCSGLALGIDGAAHRGALEAGGASVGVMATGIDSIYPRRHTELARQLQRDGCLVTEFDPGTPPRRQHFPQRNRIVSGLSLGVLVVEAALPSGSLITAQAALEQGRDVFALPWSVAHERGRGCLQLLRDGAKMVQGVEDILEELGSSHAVAAPAVNAVGAGPAVPAGVLLSLVGYEQTGLDDLVRATGRGAADLLRELAELEIRGQVARTAGGYIRT